MAITAISRDWGVDPSIVRITTTDDLTTITTTGYLSTQEANIELLQNGSFEWLDGDYILIYYSDGEGFFTRDATNDTFDAAPAAPGTLSDTLQSAHIFVGSAGNVATDRAMSGDATISNTGVLTVANSAITNAKIGAAAVTTAKMDPLLLQYVRVSMTAAQWNGMYAAPVQLIPAPGANKIIVLAEAVMSMTFVSAAYAAGGIVAIQYDNTVHGAGSIASNTEAAVDFFAASSTTYQFTPISGSTFGASTFAVTVNKGLFLSNQTGAFTTGDGTWKIDLWYRVIPSI